MLPGRRDRRGIVLSFIAVSTKEMGLLAITHSALLFGSPQTFLFDSALSSAAVTPPPPFSGTASFQRNADGSTTWAGDLAASFPGKPDVPLTGTTFSAKLACEPFFAGTIVVVRGPNGKRAARRPAASSACGCKVEK